MTVFLLVLAALAPFAALGGGVTAYQRRQKRLDALAVESHTPASLSEDELLDRKWDRRWDDSEAAFWRKHGRCAARDYAREDRAADRRLHIDLSQMEREISADAGRRADRLARNLHKTGPAWRAFRATDAIDLRAVLMLMDGWHGWHGSTTDTRWTEADSAALREYAALMDTPARR